MLTRTLAALSMLALSVASPAWAQVAPELLTKAERSEFRETATYDEVMALARALADASPRVHLTELGTSHEGRSLPLLIVSDPPVTTPEEARASGKLVVLAIGNIHAGEVCGKEALMMLAREIATTPDHPLLKDVVLCIAPIYNADGNERMAPDNRPGQVGPERMGVRPNAQGLDLNRDFVKADAPETRALLRFFRRWDPHLFIDTHTTNGSLHRYVLTYAAPKHPAGDERVLRYVRDEMLPRVTGTLRDSKGHETFFYGNFEEEHTLWTTFPAEPRYSTNYAGMRNRLAVLSEAYAYAPFKDRVMATLDFCRAVVEDAAANRELILTLVREADERAGTITEGAEIPVRTRAAAHEKPATAKGYEETRDAEGHSVAGAERDYEVKVIDNFVPSLSTPRPWAYVLPAGRDDVAELLKRHGIAIDVLREDLDATVESCRVDRLERSGESWQNRTLVSLDTTALPRTERLIAGTALVRTDQPLGPLACLMLEPESEDGLGLWGFFPDLELGGEWPILRIASRVPLLTARTPVIEEDRELHKRVTWELLNESRERPDFSGSAAGGFSWLDDERFEHWRGGERWVIDAPSGRLIERRTVDPGPLTAAIMSLGVMDEEGSRRLGESRRFIDTGATGAIFEHSGDLFYVSLDGSAARRLTNSPEAEELPSLSPDGRYAAFVRAHDLYAITLADGVERRLTTTGSADIRNGKHDWIYFEEIFGRSWRGYWWSPDSSRIAYFETDSSEVDRFTIVDDATEPQTVEVANYPKPGRPNPDVRLGIVPALGGGSSFVDLSDYTAGEFVVSSIGWWPDSSKIHFTIQDRAQRWLDLSTTGVRGGRPTKVLRDSTQAWTEAPQAFRVLRDGRFVLSSERDGYNHLYLYNADGTLANRITEGPWEVRGLESIDEDRGVIHFNATAESSITSNLYRVSLDGTGFTRLTTEPGSHSVTLSPGAKYFVDSWSSTGAPPRVALRDSEGNMIRTIDANPVYAIEEYDLGRVELVKIPTRRVQGESPIELEGMLVYPPDFDESRLYPVWFMTYAGPHAPTVNDTWGGGRANDHMLANSGFIVFRADPYSASGKGAVSAWTCYQRMGEPELEDLTDAINWLKQRPYIDGTRIGMSGFSYGGFMTAYAMTRSDLFAAGIAGGPVTSWRDYDSIYTERYMNTPQENPDGYARTSVVDRAKDLSGNLLIVHGWIDDNVHPQNSVKLIEALQSAGKPFEMMLYPRFRHGVWGRHYARMNYDFQMRLVHAPEGPRATPAPAPTESQPEAPTTNLGPSAPSGGARPGG